jgi:hypothetical protein
MTNVGARRDRLKPRRGNAQPRPSHADGSIAVKIKLATRAADLCGGRQQHFTFLDGLADRVSHPRSLRRAARRRALGAQR